MIVNILLGAAITLIAINGFNSTFPPVQHCDNIRHLLPDECSCTNVTQMLWYLTFSGIKIMCPQLVFQQFPNNMTIKCRETQREQLRPPPFKLDMGSVTCLTIRDCNTTAWSYGDIIEHFNITHVYNFRLRGHIPTLNKTLFCNLTDIFMIDINNVGLESITNDPFECLDDTTHNGHSITHLEIDGNNIKTLSDDAFKSLKRLSILNLMRNNLTNLPGSLFSQNTALDSLDLAFNKLTTLPIDLFVNLKNLTRLDLQGNQIIEIPSGLLAPLKKLEVLDLGGNLLKQLSLGEDLYLERLVHLNLRDNQLVSLDGAHAGVFALRSSIDLKHLRLDGNKLSRMYEDWTWLTQLEKLNLSYNHFTHLQIKDFGFRSNIVVDLSHNMIRDVNITSTTAPYAHQSKTCVLLLHDNPLSCACNLYTFGQHMQTTQKLQVPHAKISPLTTRTTIVDFRDVHSLKCSSPGTFRGMLFLDTLELMTCEISDGNYTCPTECSCVFRSNDKANVINCSKANLKKAPSLFSVYNKANHTILYLQENPLEHFVFPGDSNYDFINNITVLNLSNTALTDFVVSSSYKNIKVLDLSHNSLSTLSRDALTLMSTADLVLLHDNPWRCHCDDLNIITAVTTEIKVGMIGEVKCQNGTSLNDLSLSDLCPPLYSSFTIAVFFMVAGLLLASATVLCYSINYCFNRRSCKLQSKVQSLDMNKEYDAFISFTDRDIDFVTEVLVPCLEGQYKLCLRYRDWAAGEPIPKQIILSVQKSRRTIVVLSPHYLSDVGSVSEFSVAHSEASRDKVSRLILIMYGEVTGNARMNSDINSYLRTKKYIKWEDTPSFWNRIFQLMPNSSKDKGSKPTFPSVRKKSTCTPNIDMVDSFNMESFPQPMKSGDHEITPHDEYKTS